MISKCQYSHQYVSHKVRLIHSKTWFMTKADKELVQNCMHKWKVENVMHATLMILSGCDVSNVEITSIWHPAIDVRCWQRKTITNKTISDTSHEVYMTHHTRFIWHITRGLYDTSHEVYMTHHTRFIWHITRVLYDTSHEVYMTHHTRFMWHITRGFRWSVFGMKLLTSPMILQICWGYLLPRPP